MNVLVLELTKLLTRIEPCTLNIKWGVSYELRRSLALSILNAYPSLSSEPSIELDQLPVFNRYWCSESDHDGREERENEQGETRHVGTLVLGRNFL